MRTFMAAHGEEECVVRGDIQRYLTPSMQRFIHYYARTRHLWRTRGEDTRHVLERDKATWSLTCLRLAGVALSLQVCTMLSLCRSLLFFVGLFCVRVSPARGCRFKPTGIIKFLF